MNASCKIAEDFSTMEVIYYALYIRIEDYTVMEILEALPIYVMSEKNLETKPEFNRAIGDLKIILDISFFKIITLI